MRTILNQLANELFQGKTYDKDGICNFNVVSKLISDLDKKIIEAEKRMECIETFAKGINNVISQYSERVDNNESFVMSVTDHDSILLPSNDIMIALDLNDNTPITDNWYGLFTPDLKPKVEVILPKGTLLEWAKNIQYFVAKEGAKAIVVEDYTTQSDYVKVEFTDELSNHQGNGGYDLIQFNVVEKVIEDTLELSNDMAKKDEIEKILISKWANFGMDIPSNFEDIVTFVFEDVCETADPKDWTSEDVIIGFRRWIESK